MSKYDVGFKLIVVNAYLAGEGEYISLAKKFGIKRKPIYKNKLKKKTIEKQLTKEQQLEKEMVYFRS